MAVQNLVLIDTCMWVPFFNRPHSNVKHAIDELLDVDRAALIGPVVGEVLLGLRRDPEADWIASILRGARYLTVTYDEWRAAARLGRNLRGKKLPVPLTDLALAAVAIRRGFELFSTDPHFDLIDGLERFRIED